MSLRAKLLAVVLTAVALMWAACAYAYVSGTRAIEKLLSAETEARASSVASRAEETLGLYDAHLLRVAAAPSLRAHTMASANGTTREPSGELRAVVGSFLANGEGNLVALTLVGSGGTPLLRAWPDAKDGTQGEIIFQTEDLIASTVRADERVWSANVPAVLRSKVSQEAYGSGVRLTAPVFAAEGGARPSGALVLELRLDALLEQADRVVALDKSSASSARAAQSDSKSIVVALDNQTGRVVYHPNAVLRNQPADAALPFFAPVRERMVKGERGLSEFRDAPGGSRWLAAHTQLEGLNVSVAAAANYTRAAADFTRVARLALALAGLAGIASITLVFLISTHATRRIGRVAEGAAAIARGDLEQHVRVDASGEMGALAESFNLMSERLHEHIRREAETKQFESFMRLSAMLTHDLKNAITGLSMLVSNMERLFDREEFREDAIASLRDATEKLKRVVARLSEPVKSLSGEYRREARPTDLVPVIKRVLAMNAVPAASFLEIEVRLPEKLMATVEPERIENVIENLIINALEAMGATGGKLTVEAGEMEGGLVSFSVSDTGAGMSEEFIRTRLFRPFTTTKTKGIGLGLYTCREIVEAHGGRLEVDSRPGVGTRFRVVLPSTLFQSRDRERRAEKRTPAVSAPEEHSA